MTMGTARLLKFFITVIIIIIIIIIITLLIIMIIIVCCSAGHTQDAGQHYSGARGHLGHSRVCSPALPPSALPPSTLP